LAHRYTPLDYAKLYNQNACVDILTNSGGVTAHTIKEMAAISIQALYRGHRYQVHVTLVIPTDNNPKYII